MMPVIGNIVPKVVSSQLLLNQGGTGLRTLALGGWQWANNPASGGHLSGLTNPLESYSNPSALAIPATGQDWGYDTNQYGYDTGGVTLVASPIGGRSEASFIDDVATPISIEFDVSTGGGTSSGYLKVEFMGKVLYEATGPNHNFILNLTPAQSGWLLTNGGTLKYRAFAMNNENISNSIQVNITPTNGLIFMHING